MQKLDRAETNERFMLRPLSNVSFFKAGALFGFGLSSGDSGLLFLGPSMFALYYLMTELYWRSAYDVRVAMRNQIRQLKEHVRMSYAWADRWRSIAMGHGDPWKPREQADA